MTPLVDRSSLPTNVKRWLDRSVPADTPVPERVANTQTGEIQVRGRWMTFTAATSYDRDPFAFRWVARIGILPGVTVVAEDAHNGSAGWGGSRLWGLIPMGSRNGREVFGMQLVRHLAEFPWMPQLALGMPDLIWSDTGDSTFQVSIDTAGHVEAVTFTLDLQDRVISATSNRAYDVPGGFEQAPWRCEFSGHRSFGDIEMPEEATSTYSKDDGEWPYWRCKVATTTSEHIPISL